MQKLRGVRTVKRKVNDDGVIRQDDLKFFGFCMFCKSHNGGGANFPSMFMIVSTVYGCFSKRVFYVVD